MGIMKALDDTQNKLMVYLGETEKIMNDLLCRSPYNGYARIISNLDLGFPHDVIRLAGGFATGICVRWESCVPFIPVDICMNACTVSIYELSDGKIEFFNVENIKKLLTNLEHSSYIANFHRGNHFISLLQSVQDEKYFIMIHSSAAEFETLFNGLYPVEGNWVYENTKVHFAHGRYLRYVEGKAAETYAKLADNLYAFNENRHDFIISAMLGNLERINSVQHYHHYGMPCSNVALLGSHLIRNGQTAPLLTRPGENIYLIRYNEVIDKSLELMPGKEYFITPHGFGKNSTKQTQMRVDYDKNAFFLDSKRYKIIYGERLSDKPRLEIRSIQMDKYFEYFSKSYIYEIEKEFKQLASYSKLGFIKW